MATEKVLPYSGQVWRAECLANLLFSSVWRKKVWRINRSAKGLSMVTTNLDGFSLANRRRFAKFAKLSPRQTFPLYGTLEPLRLWTSTIDELFYIEQRFSLWHVGQAELKLQTILNLCEKQWTYSIVFIALLC